MYRRLSVAAMAITTLVSVSQTSFAAPLHKAPAAGYTTPGTEKPVKFNLRNDGSMALTVKAGDQQIDLQPGKTTQVTLPEGTQLTAVTATEKTPAGTVLSTVNRSLEGGTIALK